jgi:hypothetical protein
MTKKYTVSLMGNCSEARIYELNQEAVDYWDSSIGYDTVDISDYMEGNAPEDMPEDADFLNGDDRYDAESIVKNFTTVNIPECWLVIESDNDEKEVVELCSDSHGITVDWLEEETEDFQGLLVTENKKGLIFQSEIEIKGDFDKSKLKILLQEEEQGDAFIGLFYDEEEMDFTDYSLQHKGSYYEII